MNVLEFRKNLCESAGGRDKLQLIEQIVREIWNDDRLNREDLIFVSYLLAWKVKDL